MQRLTAGSLIDPGNLLVPPTGISAHLRNPLDGDCEPRENQILRQSREHASRRLTPHTKGVSGSQNRSGRQGLLPAYQGIEIVA